MGKNYLKLFSQITDYNQSELGGKGSSLAFLYNNSFKVPNGFIVASGAFLEFLEENGLTERVKELLHVDESELKSASERLKAYILSKDINKDLAFALEESLSLLHAERVAIRSSAIGEDTAKTSFAGMHDSFLNIAPNLEEVFEGLKKCWASVVNVRAIAYRKERGITSIPSIAVVVQKMISAEVSGVTFTADPISGDISKMMVSTTWGLGEALVSGMVTPDEYVIDKDNLAILKRKLGSKKLTYKETDKGIERVSTEETKAKKFSISDETVKRISSVCIKIEKLFGRPQDIEWCIADDVIWIVQSRPITTMP